MVNYGNGKIYKIVANNGKDGDIYIGSTSKKYLSQRMDRHRCAYKEWKLGNFHFITAFELFDKYGVENCKIILIENCPCESKDELIARERHWYESLECFNKNKPGIFNELGKTQYNKEYYIEHKTDLLQASKIYHTNNKESIAKNVKKYHTLNKENIKIYKKNYYQENKVRLSKTEKCVCGSVTSIDRRSAHLKTKLHQNYVKEHEKDD